MSNLSDIVTRNDINPGDHIYTFCRYNFTKYVHGIFIGENKVIHFSRMIWLSSSQPNHTSSPCPSFPNCGLRQPNSSVVLFCLDCFLQNGPLCLYQYGVPLFFFSFRNPDKQQDCLLSQHHGGSLQANRLGCQVRSHVGLTSIGGHLLALHGAGQQANRSHKGGTCTTASSDSPETVIHRATYLLQTGFGNFDLEMNDSEDFALYCKTGLWIDKQGIGRSGQIALPPGGYWRRSADVGLRIDVIKIEVEELAAKMGWTCAN